MIDVHQAAQRFARADQEWAAELRRQYGKRACEARYDARRNRATQGLAILADMREAAREDWERVAFGRCCVTA